MSAKATKILLLIDDSPGDVRLTREAFRDAGSSIDVHVAYDGLEALAFLRREGVHAHVPRPDLILLDLNLSRMAGHEVLAQIKTDERLKAIPTVILSSSTTPENIAISYQLQANGYLNKPVQADAFTILMKGVQDFWLTRVRLPPHERSEWP